MCTDAEEETLREVEDAESVGEDGGRTGRTGEGGRGTHKDLTVFLCESCWASSEENTVSCRSSQNVCIRWSLY